MAKEIRDSIHGSIKLDELELSLLDTPEMQRLRRIKQLGFTYLAYPSATHTRFEHSLGVMHLAGRIAESVGLSKDDIQLSRICGLLHDLGHTAFSHTFEALVEKHSKQTHEEVACSIIHADPIKSVLSKSSFSSKDVTDVLMGKNRPVSDIISSDLDADRMDYLLRDSHYTGVAYGLIDLERMIHTLAIHNDELVLTDLPAAEFLLRARSLMYPTVYEHHTARIAESMFSHAIEYLILHHGLEIPALLKMDDIDLIAMLRASKRYPKDIIGLIDNRTLFKRALVVGRPDIGTASVQRFAAMRDDLKQMDRIESQISDKVGLHHGYVLLDILEPLYPDGLDLKILKDGKVLHASSLSTAIKTMNDSQWDYWRMSVFSPAAGKEAVRKAALSVLNLDLKKSSQKKLTE